jgi:hypothetical protein
MKIDDQNIIKMLSEKDTVFHYTKMTTGVEKILETSRLELGSFSQTNDPLEYNIRFFGYDKNLESDKNLSAKKELLQEKLLYHSFFLSTCINKKNNLGYTRMRMWSQYGDNNKGICFALSKSNITKELNEKYRTTNFIFSDIVHYNYSQIDIFNNYFMKDLNIKNDNINDYVLEYIHKESKNLFFKKCKDYRDESEYRFIAVNRNHNDGNVFLDINKIVKAIIIGDGQNRNYFNVYSHFNIPVIIFKWDMGNIKLASI